MAKILIESFKNVSASCRYAERRFGEIKSTLPSEVPGFKSREKPHS